MDKRKKAPLVIRGVQQKRIELLVLGFFFGQFLSNTFGASGVAVAEDLASDGRKMSPADGTLHRTRHVRTSIVCFSIIIAMHTGFVNRKILLRG